YRTTIGKWLGNKVVQARPAPAFGEVGEVGSVDGLGFDVLLLPGVVLGELAFGLELGELGLFPLLAALLPDAFEEDAGRLHVGVLGAPLSGQVAAEGGCEDGLSELVEQLRHLLERLPRLTALLRQRIDLGNDA